MVINPWIFLPWFRRQLENTSGVKFIRKEVQSLSELKGFGHDVLINASGVGSYSLQDVRDPDVQAIRGQTILVRHGYNKSFQRDDATGYTYAIPRLDGTVILGGVRQFGRT